MIIQISKIWLKYPYLITHKYTIYIRVNKFIIGEKIIHLPPILFGNLLYLDKGK